MLLTLAVVLPTPHDYSGTFQGGYSARFTPSRRGLMGARRSLETAKNYAGPSTYTQCVYTLHIHHILICIRTHTHPYIHPHTIHTQTYTHIPMYMLCIHMHTHTYKVILTQTYTYVLCVHMYAQPTHNRTPITWWHDINTPWPAQFTMARTPHTHGSIIKNLLDKHRLCT